MDVRQVVTAPACLTAGASILAVSTCSGSTTLTTTREILWKASRPFACSVVRGEPSSSSGGRGGAAGEKGVGHRALAAPALLLLLLVPPRTHQDVARLRVRLRQPLLDHGVHHLVRHEAPHFFKTFFYRPSVSSLIAWWMMSPDDIARAHGGDALRLGQAPRKGALADARSARKT